MGLSFQRGIGVGLSFQGGDRGGSLSGSSVSSPFKLLLQYRYHFNGQLLMDSGFNVKLCLDVRPFKLIICYVLKIILYLQSETRGDRCADKL